MRATAMIESPSFAGGSTGRNISQVLPAGKELANARNPITKTSLISPRLKSGALRLVLVTQSEISRGIPEEMLRNHIQQTLVACITFQEINRWVNKLRDLPGCDRVFYQPWKIHFQHVATIGLHIQKDRIINPILDFHVIHDDLHLLDNLIDVTLVFRVKMFQQGLIGFQVVFCSRVMIRSSIPIETTFGT